MEDAHPNLKTRVLVASTDVSVRKLLSSSLSRDRRFTIVAQAGDGDAVVTSTTDFDIAVVDVSISGLGILGVMSNLRRSASQPIVIVVSRTDAIYLRHACLAEGATDYLVIPDDLPGLPERVARASEASPALVTSE
jgi:DNA-binding response OmpR family regulator